MDVAVALIRHGQTAWNVERRFLGITDIPLDETGHAQARSLAAELAARAVGGTGAAPFAAVYSSPLVRALETARYLGDPVRVVHDLREMDQGELEGLPGEVALGRYPQFFRAWVEDPADVAAPGGETLRAVQERALNALRGLAADHTPGSAIAVVTHQLVIASVACAATGSALREWRRFGLRNTGIWTLKYVGETLILLDPASGEER